MAETKKIENVDDYKGDELKALAEEAGVSKAGTKQEIADRINAAAEVPAGDSGEIPEKPATPAVEAQPRELTPPPTAEESKARETDGKEASVPPSDPRSSVFDPAPGKTLTEVQDRVAAHANGENQDPETPADDAAAEARDAYRDAITPKGVQYYVVQEDDHDLIDVARKLELPNHSELGAINGIYNGRYELQKGQKVLLPDTYNFVDVDNVETAE